MKKFSLVIAVAALLSACGGTVMSSSQASSEEVSSEVASSEEATTVVAESSSDETDSSEPEVSSEAEISSEEEPSSLEVENSPEAESSEIETKTQLVSFAESSGSGEYTDDELTAVMAGDLITSVSGVSKVYKSAGSGGAHANEEGLIKTGTSKADATMTINCAEAVKSITLNCHDFYKLSEQYPTNSNTITINGEEKLAPYNETAEGEDLVWNFTDGIETITFTAKRVYIWTITLVA